MRVQPVILEENKIRYILVDDDGLPVIPVIKYLKYLDNTDKSKNTIKTYCHSLKLYFEFLKEIRKDYREVNISVLFLCVHFHALSYFTLTLEFRILR